MAHCRVQRSTSRREFTVSYELVVPGATVKCDTLDDLLAAYSALVCRPIPGESLPGVIDPPRGFHDRREDALNAAFGHNVQRPLADTRSSKVFDRDMVKRPNLTMLRGSDSTSPWERGEELSPFGDLSDGLAAEATTIREPSSIDEPSNSIRSVPPIVLRQIYFEIYELVLEAGQAGIATADVATILGEDRALVSNRMQQLKARGVVEGVPGRSRWRVNTAVTGRREVLVRD